MYDTGARSLRASKESHIIFESLQKLVDFFGYQGEPKILYSVMYADMSKLIAKTILTHSPLPDHLCMN